MLLIAIPVAAFHFVSGRYANGAMATCAVLAGVALLAIDLRGSSRPGDTHRASADQFAPEDYWWPDRADDLHDIADLDRVTDEPLPAPFQALLDELQRSGARDRDAR